MTKRATRPAAAALLAALLAGGCGAIVRPDLPDEPSPATLAAVRALARHPCNETTAAALDGLGVRPGDLRSIYYDRRVTGEGRGILQGYDAWTGLNGRPGELIVRHNPTCSFMTSYTRGGMVLTPPG